MTASEAKLYRTLCRIRRFEETALEQFPSGVFYGTTHTYLGQEANAVGVLEHLRDGDIVMSNHRCHGHFLAYGGDPRALFAEMMGRQTGVCGGLGGSQHLQWRNFYSNGILGGTVPVATGMALAERRLASGAVTVAFLGDGALGEGAVYEALNMAALWQAPILYVLEHNGVAQTTPTELAAAGTFADRFTAFGIPVHELDSSDVAEILPLAGQLFGQIRDAGGPRALILRTHRFGPHSKGDDPRPREYLERVRAERDPVTIQGRRLEPTLRRRIATEANEEIGRAFAQATEDPFARVLQVVGR